jgi:hypothetical protein
MGMEVAEEVAPWSMSHLEADTLMYWSSWVATVNSDCASSSRG